MKPVAVKLADHVAGDTWQGILQIGPVRCGLTGTDPMPVAAASARLHLTLRGSASPSLRLETGAAGDAPITMLSGPDWSFVIPPVPHSVWTPVAGIYSGHYEVTDTAGTVLTIYDITFTVLADKTR